MCPRPQLNITISPFLSKVNQFCVGVTTAIWAARMRLAITVGWGYDAEVPLSPKPVARAH